MNCLRIRFPFIMASMLCCLSSGSCADDDNAKAWFSMMVQQAERYEFTSRSGEGRISRTEKPVFRHDAPSRNSDDIGGVWLWSDQNHRPVAVGTVFGWTSGPGTRTVLHEFCSLSRSEFQAVWKHDGQLDKWTPRQSASWKHIPDSPAPSEQFGKLKIQLRKEASRFSAHTFDRSQRRWQLRLLPRPVFAFGPADSELLLGGAVFVICQDTNTDVVLGIEAVRDDKESPYRFEYALGSFTDWNLHVELDGEEIWTEDASDPRGADALHWVRKTGQIQLQD